MKPIKTLKDKGYYCGNEIPSVFVFEEEDLKQAIKDLKEELKDLKYGIHPSSQFAVKRLIDKIMGVWEE